MKEGNPCLKNLKEDNSILFCYVSGNSWTSGHELLQIDLAPTMSILMGLPIPSNNLGQLLLQPLGTLTDTEKLASVYINAQQIVSLMKPNVANFKKGTANLMVNVDTKRCFHESTKKENEPCFIHDYIWLLLRIWVHDQGPCYSIYLPLNQTTSCQYKLSKKVQQIRELQSVLPC